MNMNWELKLLLSKIRLKFEIAGFIRFFLCSYQGSKSVARNTLFIKK